jgi:hypothetical protein
VARASTTTAGAANRHTDEVVVVTAPTSHCEQYNPKQREVFHGYPSPAFYYIATEPQSLATLQRVVLP